MTHPKGYTGPRQCSILIFDRKVAATDGAVVIRPCGAPAGQTLSLNGDMLFAICGRHNSRLERDGVVAANEQETPAP